MQFYVCLLIYAIYVCLLQQIMAYLASIDQSTTSTKFSIFNTEGQLVAKQVLEHQQICPKEGWLQHNPSQIITNIDICIQKTIATMKKNPQFSIEQIKGLGVTNQRQTIICWNKQGKPFYNAIVWCDSRTKDICEQFKAKHGEFKHKTGLPVSTYFSLFKILWLIKNVPEVSKAMQEDDIRFGTIDTWVVYNLTGEYVTDASNASRTYLCNLNGEWDEELMQLVGIKSTQLPTIVDSFCDIATIINGQLKGIKICSILGDQQSSAYAHELKKNEVKITYGTGCFLLANIGNNPFIHQSFVTTIIYKHKGVIEYAFECSVECGGGTLNWAKRAGFFNDYAQLNQFQDISHQELFFFPSFGEIYAPFWKSNVKGGISGLGLSTRRSHIISALLESIVFRVKDNLRFNNFDGVVNIFADGGMTVNHRFMQVQADILKKTITVRERDTCWGVAKGVLTSCNEQLKGFQDQNVVTYVPQMENNAKLQAKYSRWCAQRLRFYGWN